MRLNKIISSRSGISRRAADKLIKDGKVLIDGQRANLTDKVKDLTRITVSGSPLPNEKNIILIMLNKPVGYVCSHAGQGSKTVFELLPSELHQLNPIGRLDKDSCGLILLTNDGDLHNKLTHPSYEKIKTYIVVLDKNLSSNDKNKLKNGVLLNDGVSKLQISENYQMSIVVKMHEGRNRQIRRTFAKLGYRVTSLQRTSFGPYKLGKLKSGEYSAII